MTNKLLPFTFIFCLFFTLTANSQNFNLQGKWENKKHKISYTFKKDSSVVFYQGSAGVFINSYQLDKSKNPVWLDFTLKQGAQSMLIPALIEFIDENTIKIEQFPPFSKHPVKFSVEGELNFRNQHVLVRQ